MCGIAGFVNLDGSPADPEQLHRMADAMRLRGPDGEGFFLEGPFGLAHRRLSIIDLDGGAQPIANENSTMFIVVNGEIYNFPELRKTLEAKGHRFRTRSDSECALHAYEEYGTDFVQCLDGMFAIAIYDSIRKKFILARDRAGEKPLFLYSDEKQFAFASSLNALKPCDTARGPGYWEFLSFQYFPYGGGVTRMEKASVLEVDPARRNAAGGVEPTACDYFHPMFQKRTPELSFADSAAALRKLVTESVRERMVSDVPLGVFLSGGLDSAIIAAAASRIPSGEPLKCYSIGFSDPAYDESEQARRNFEHIRNHANRPVEFHHKVVNANDFGVLKSVLAFCGQPFGDSSILPTYLLCKFAREQVTVALSGDGADELFGGYERCLVMRKLAKLDWIPRFVRGPAFLALAALISGAGGDRTTSARLKRLLNAAARNPAERYLFLISAFTEREKRKLCASVPGGRMSDAFLKNFRRMCLSPEYFDFHCYLPGDILTKTDTASMANSLEVRAPFLSRKIIEFAESLPDSYKTCGMNRKVLLAEAFRGYYPPGLETMRKRGFGIPLAAWMRGPWKPYLEEYVRNGRCVRENLFSRSYVEKLIREHCENRADHSKKLYTLLAFELGLPEFRSQNTPLSYP